MRSPMTFMEMASHITEHFVSSLGAERRDAARRAADALGRLVTEGYVKPCGTNEDGETLYGPSATVIILRRG